MDASDPQLISQYLSGDEKSLELLIQRYLQQIYIFVYRLVGDSAVAEDLTQEIFVRVWKNIKKFKRDKNFKTWIYRVARNAAIDFLRKKKAIPLSVFENEDGENFLLDNLPDESALPSELFQRKELANDIAAAMRKLPSLQMAVLSLYFESELNFREISEITKEPLDTVKSRYRRGLASLRKLLIRDNAPKCGSNSYK